MHIGIDIRLLGKARTGDEAVFFFLTRSLISIDSKNTYTLFTNETDPNKLTVLHHRLGCIGNPRVKIVTLAGGNRFFWNAVSLPFHLFRVPVDVYHTQYIAPLIVPRRTRLFLHIHDVSFWAHPEWISRVDRFFLDRLIPRSLRRAAALITPSLFTKNELVRFGHVSPEKIYCLPNACGPEWLASVGEEMIAQIKAKYGINGQYIVSSGTMQPRKNIPLLIRAVDSLRRRLPDIQLVLPGNPMGHHVDPIVREAFVSKHPGIIFPGYLQFDELQALIAGASVFSFPSLYEGFGIPLLEAFAVGVPVVASDIPALREVAATAALFYPPSSLAEAENSLYTLCVDEPKRQQLIGLGSERLRQYSWDESARRLLALYLDS